MIDYSIIGKRFGRLTVLDLDHIGKIIVHIGNVNVIVEMRK